MRDIASCFGEYATQVSDASCSSYANTSCIIPPNLTPSVQNAVTCLYKTILSNQKHLHFTATWTKNTMSQGLTIHFNTNNPLIKLNTSSRFFRKKKGSKSVEFESTRFDLFWDLSEAKYSSGPEPVSGYYILIMVGSELALVLGKMAEEAVSKKVKSGTKMAKFSLVSRKEHFSGNTLYSTKARFCEKGIEHDILIRCSGESEGLKCPILSVSIDKKTVTRVKRLQWNFRGSQSIFLDGMLIDLMWDVHDWFFHNPSSSSSSSSGSAVFMFRTRSGMESRLWLEEREDGKEKSEFSLLIYACKSP